MTVYLNDWADAGEAGMLRDFGVGPEVLTGAEVLVATYTYENYEGSAYVLFKRDGKFFEIIGGHCSCHGLNEASYSGGPTQWQPEEVDEAALRHRIANGTWGELASVKDTVLEALSSKAS